MAISVRRLELCTECYNFVDSLLDGGVSYEDARIMAYENYPEDIVAIMLSIYFE